MDTDEIFETALDGLTHEKDRLLAAMAKLDMMIQAMKDEIACPHMAPTALGTKAARFGEAEDKPVAAPAKKQKMSSAARKKIAAAQKARWKKFREEKAEVA